MKAKKAEETVKTNVMRLLEAAGISFETGTYEVDENDLSGSHAADLMGVDHDTMYKTLVLKGEKKGYLVCCLPVDEELDLKKAALIFVLVHHLAQLCFHLGKGFPQSSVLSRKHSEN